MAVELSASERQKRVRNYFTPDPRIRVRDYVKVAVGIVLIVAGASAAFFRIVGVLVLLWGIAGFALYGIRVLRRRPRATDQQIDQWKYDALAPIAERGSKRLNVHPTELEAADDEGGRLVFVGIPDFGEGTASVVKSKRGKDRVWRFSAYEVMVLYLSNWRLPVYTSILDMETGNFVTDETKEYNLSQVDGIETFSDRINKVSKGTGDKKSADDEMVVHWTRQQSITLVVSGRRVVDLLIGVATSQSVQIENVTAQSEIDALIARLREHLRMHHHGAQRHHDGLGSLGQSPLGPPASLSLDLPPQSSPGSRGIGPGDD